MHCLIGADEGLEGNRECLWETGLSGQSSHRCHGSVGDSSGDKVCVWPSGLSSKQGVTGSGSSGGASNIGLSKSSTGQDTGFCITCLMNSSMDKY